MYMYITCTWTMINIGELTFPITPHMAVILGIQIGSMFLGQCAECCGQCCHGLCYMFTCGYCCAGDGEGGNGGGIPGATQDGRPVYCDGTCNGAKKARKEYRKKLRKMKRKGEDTSKMPPWWEYQKYTCTHVIKYVTYSPVKLQSLNSYFTKKCLNV